MLLYFFVKALISGSYEYLPLLPEEPPCSIPIKHSPEGTDFKFFGAKAISVLIAFVFFDIINSIFPVCID